MATIPQTYLGSPNAPDICSGFAMFNKGAARAGLSLAGGAPTVLCDASATIALWNFSAYASFSMSLGICGPAYGIAFNVQGTADESGINLAVSNDVINAGMFFGADYNVALQISVQQMSFSWVWDGWKSHIGTTWNNIASLNANFNLDPIGLVSGIIVDLLEDSAETKTLFKQLTKSLFTTIPSSWGFTDYEAGNFASLGDFGADPLLSLPIDVVPLLKESVPALGAAVDALEKIAGGVSFGPTLGMAFPLTVEIDEVTVDDAVYGNITVAGSSLTGSLTSGSVSDNPSSITAKLKERPGIDFTVGVFANINVLKLFNLGGSYTFPLLSEFGLNPDLETNYHTVSNSIGATISPARGASASRSTKRPKVVLRPEGSMS